MNNKRRRKLEKLKDQLEEIKDQLEELKDDLEILTEELEEETDEEEWISETERVSAHISITHETSQEAVISMESAIEGAEGIAESLEEIIEAFD